MTMPDDPNSQWPRFELVRVAAPTDLPPELVSPFEEQGVPKSLFGRYQAAQTLSVLRMVGYGSLVCFGSSGYFHRICLDTATRKVMKILTTPNGRKSVVNSSLSQFAASVRVALERFPYDSVVIGVDAAEDSLVDQLESEWDRAANELKDMLGQIDPLIFEVDGF